MTRDRRQLGHLPFWRGRCCHIIVVLITSIPVWLSPSALFASDITQSSAGHDAKPARRGVGTPDSSLLPARQVELFERHLASEPEESFESKAEPEDPMVGMLPSSQHHLAISRIGAMSVHARLSLLQSRGLPLIC